MAEERERALALVMTIRDCGTRQGVFEFKLSEDDAVEEVLAFASAFQPKN